MSQDLTILQLEIDEICKIHDEYEQLKEKLQVKLKEYVNNKNYPLDKRFEIWKKYCDKEHKGWIIHKGEFGCIGEIVNDQALFPYMYEDRHRKFEYSDFLDRIYEYFPGDEWSKREDAEKYVSSVEEFKEVLIETNFGSFINDW